MRRLGGVFTRHCPVCGFHGKFHAYGLPPRFDARCPRCGSLERHRLFKIWLDAGGRELVRDTRLLHFAPEPSIARLVKPIARKYVSADIVPGKADINLDIEKTGLAGDSFDCVLCSHVLEHVDDRAALTEMRRIMNDGGVMILMVPLIEGWSETYENTSITTPKDRLKFYGQEDHIRRYGADFRRRVLSAGFSLSEFTAIEPQVSNHGLLHGDKIFVARPNRESTLWA